jgi:hypothetical protein
MNLHFFVLFAGLSSKEIISDVNAVSSTTLDKED